MPRFLRWLLPVLGIVVVGAGVLILRTPRAPLRESAMPQALLLNAPQSPSPALPSPPALGHALSPTPLHASSEDAYSSSIPIPGGVAHEAASDCPHCEPYCEPYSSTHIPGGGARRLLPPALSSPSLPGHALSPTPPRTLSKDAYYSSTYIPGGGDRERVEKLLREGVVIDGKKFQLAAFTRHYHQAFPIPTDKALSLTAQTEHAALVQTGGETHLQVGLQAIGQEAPRRPPLNLTFVVDVSGSMGDEGKLEAVKEAVLRFLDALDQRDYVAIVVYHDAPRVLLPAQPLRQKEQAKALVRSLEAGGSTNIYEGLQTGYAEARKHLLEDGVNTVLLLSDGLVTAGISDPAAFRTLAQEAFDQGIQTTTIGVGLDYDEALMLAIAQAGKGHYHFIQSAEGVERVFQKELHQLTHVVAKAVKVRIVLSEGVELLKVYGSEQLSPEEAKAIREEEKRMDLRVAEELGIAPDRQKEDEPGIKFFLPHFYLGDTHVIMLQIQVPPGRRGREVATVFVKYKDLVYRRNRELQVPVRVEYVGSKQEMVASLRREVKKNVLGFRTGEVLLRVARLLEQGRNAEAVKELDAHKVLLAVAAREWNDEDLLRDTDLLAQYQEALTRFGNRHLASSEVGRYLQKSLTYSAAALLR